MKKLVLLAALGGVLAVAGCASDGGYAGGGYGYNYYGPSDVWYDGYYGPYVDGYWGDGGAFFYRDGQGHYQRDSSGHFRSHAFSGGEHFNASRHSR